MIFSSWPFLQKINDKFDFTTMIPQVDLFSFVFWRKLKHQKGISRLTDLESKITRAREKKEPQIMCLSNQISTSEWIWPHCVPSWHTAYSILLRTMMMIKMGLETTLWIVLRFAGLSPASLPTIWPAGQQPNKPKRYLATQIGNKDKDNSLEDSYPDVAMAWPH